ncbi:MAG: hypothetical protein ACOCP5_04220 [Halanaerobiaceae bacterium]
MKEDILTFENINIRKAPGFDPPGFSVDELSPQVNLIYGPNAVGKTTLGRAFNYLLWPERLAPPNINIQGNFTLNNSNWFVEINFDKILYQKDGTTNSAPFLPPVEHKDRYFITLPDLLQDDIKDISLAKIIMQESTGGFDLSKVIEELDLKDRPSPKGKNTRKAQKRINEYKNVYKHQHDLEQKENKLKDLYEEKKIIKSSRKKLNIFTRVIEYKKTRIDLDKIKAKLDKFPENMNLIEGDEYSEINKIDQKMEKLKTKIRLEKNKIKKANHKLKQVDLKKIPKNNYFITRIKNKKDQLLSKKEKLEKIADDLIKAKNKKKEEEKLFQNSMETSKIKSIQEIDCCKYNQLSDFALEAEKINNKLLSYKYLKDLIKPEDNIQKEERAVKKGSRYLEDWLQIPDSESEGKNKLKYLSLVSIGLVSGLSIFLGWLIHPGYLLFLLLSVGLFWYYRTDKNGNIDYKAKVKKEYNQLNLDPPERWQKNDVRKKLEDLYDEIVRIKFIKRRQQYWQDRKKEYERLLSKHNKLNKKRKKFINKYGMAPGTGDQALYYFTNRLSRWQDANIEIKSIKKTLDRKQKNYNNLLDEINQELSEYGYKISENTAEISANINDLENRFREYEKETKNKINAEENLEQVQKTYTDLKKRKQEIYKRISLKPEKKEKLKKLCDDYKNYLNLKQEYENLKFVCSRELKKLKKLAGFSQDILNKNIHQLKVEQDELSQIVDRFEEVQKNINEIETRIAAVKEKRSIEKALANKERALDRLYQDLESDYEKIAGKVISDYIREINKINNRPEVFNKAQNIFRNITRGNFRLEVSNTEPPSFKAIDSDTGKARNLDQLSSGTRIQLLLAVRMAFVDIQEKNIVLPVYFDETLANSDEKRAESIIRSILNLVKKGRQSFYFTAQKQEINKWISILQSKEYKSKIDYKIINLNRKFNKNKTEIFSDLEDIIPEIESVPSASGLSHKEYGEKLSVPDFNPFQGAESAHLWYIIEDVELLEKLLNKGIERWGQFKILLKNKADLDFINSKKLREIKTMGACLTEFIRCWKIGRGKPVDRLVLKRSGAVSDNFIDEVSELAERVEGNAESIIDKLRKGEVSNFLSRKIDDLENYFIENEYIDNVSTLEGEEIYLHMLSVKSVSETGEFKEKIKRLLNRLDQK